jgi:4-amino-4-deoxy-L-arabinose transferase-like glycosyltransferase
MKNITQSIIPFLKNNRILILLFSIIFIGSFLRLYRFDDLTRFNTDQVRDVEVAENILEGKEFPLLGPKAGGTLFKLGPAFYYFEAFSGFVFGSTPSKMVLFVMLLAIASIPLLFYFLRYHFSVYVSLFLVLIYSFSFYVIKYSRFGWNPNIIPFFFILFLLSLLKIIESENKKFGIWHVLLIISLGIGTQLHTLLLILMPVLFVLSYAYIFFKKKKINFWHFFMIIFAVLLINAPFFIYDFQNNGKNLKNFFAGTEKKTLKNSSLAENILKDGQFFIQGNTYAISSFEPQKNWIKAKKLLDSKNYGEITAAVCGTLFGLFGFFYLIKNFFTERNERKKIFLGSVLVSTFLSFLILFPIANELNVRYFIILIFLPYIFLGFFVNFLLKKFPKKLALFVIIVSFLFLAVINLRTYIRTYNLENYTARASYYGGISVKESRDISSFMFNLSKRNELAGKKFSMLPFKFEPSIRYFNNKNGLKLTDSATPGLKNSDLIIFSIFDQTDIERVSKMKESGYEIIDLMKTGRFTIFAFEKK